MLKTSPSGNVALAPVSSPLLFLSTSLYAKRPPAPEGESSFTQEAILLRRNDRSSRSLASAFQSVIGGQGLTGALARLSTALLGSSALATPVVASGNSHAYSNVVVAAS